ncbi:hypothetical protein, partial [Klebsiella pneumoniae]|uniref:hypothetical protein n=1 Tax=Klebsiella pneumoniae TaxID=573 RepID=UPI0035BA062C
LKIGVSVRHIFKPISYLEIQLLSGVSGGYITYMDTSIPSGGCLVHNFYHEVLLWRIFNDLGHGSRERF